MKIAHITDLHLGAHSDDAWRALTEKLNEINPTVFVFSGDFTENNDLIHFQRFLDWLRDEISVSDSTARFGLRLGDNYDQRAFLVPGNHDYFERSISFNSGTAGIVGLKTCFTDVFPKNKLPSWSFLDRGKDPSIFIVALDSNMKQNTVAVGLVSNEDLKQIEEWCERARHGQLKKEAFLLGCGSLKNQQEAIKSFKRAIKILVLHHYIILPTARDAEWHMGLENARDVLVRAAVDDFDIILCGHDHHDYVECYSYLTALDKRAVRRFARMYCIRQCGQRTTSVYELDAKNGKMFSRSMRIAIDFLRTKLEVIEESLCTRKYFGFGLQIDQFHRKKGIREFIRIDIRGTPLRDALGKIAAVVEEEMETIMKKRSLIHGMSPSALKKNEITKGFNLLTVEKDRRVKIEKYRMDMNGDFCIKVEEIKSYDIPTPADYFSNHAYKILREKNLVRDEEVE